MLSAIKHIMIFYIILPKINFISIMMMIYFLTKNLINIKNKENSQTSVIQMILNQMTLKYMKMKYKVKNMKSILIILLIPVNKKLIKVIY